MGVAVVGAMALGVSVLAAPRGADNAVRGTDKTGTEVTRLVTGDPAQINQVVAGAGLTAKMRFRPVNPPTGLPAYPAGVTIVGNELRIDRATNKDGFRAWFNVQLSDWDPLNDGPNLATFQMKINEMGYYSSSCKDLVPNLICDGGVNAGAACALSVDCPGGDCGADLKPAKVACPGDDPTPCSTAFGEAWAACTGGLCDAGYIDGAAGRPDSWCAPGGALGCNQSGVAIGTFNYNYFAVSNLVPGHVDQDNTCVGGGRAGQGCTNDAYCQAGSTCTGPKLSSYYGGTLVLDLPANAKGSYTVNLNQDETFIASPGAPPVDVPTLEESGFVVNFVTGSCCFALGTQNAGCMDTCLNRSDCAAQPGPRVFTPGAVCENPPSDDGCVECVSAADGLPGGLCDDHDACTTETCNVAIGVCDRGFKAGFNPIKGGAGDTGNCCDSVSGNLSNKDDGDDCTCDSCTVTDGNRGIAQHIPCAGSCDDGNPCTVQDRCDGQRPESTGGCAGTDVNSLPCSSNTDCPTDPAGINYACTDGTCFCTLTPKLTFVLDAPAKTCVGGFTPGAPCAKDSDCPGEGVCDLFPANCFDEGEKISALVHIGSAGAPINGGQFLIKYDPGCVDYNGIACLPPYGTTVYGPIVNETAGTIFIACGVDPFSKTDGPLGNINILSLSVTMIGECNNCDLCFGGDIPPGQPGSTNPLNTYLVNDGGYKVTVETQCKEIAENGDLVLNVPDSFKTNTDCDVPTATEAWTAPSATFSCGEANLSCRGAHESGYIYNMTPGANSYLDGGVLLQGQNSFCCYAWAKDKCEQTIGCTGDATNCVDADNSGKQDGCWTVEVTDETSLDIHVQLEPPIAAIGELERCIEFCLYGPCTDPPYCFQENMVFGGLFQFIGKHNGKIKVPKGKWGCITAQDQLHSLRSCAIPDCINGQLQARFKGDPSAHPAGNWLVMGNLDAWKKANPEEDPSLDVIDILDFGKFVSQYQVCYEDRKYGCHEGPHADIDGDGCVTMDDYQFVLRNFLVSSKDCCCGPSAADSPPALTEVTVDQLRQMGEDDLIAADLNGDGVLNADDMSAFLSGARPAKSNDRKGGKGLRSGR
jgi:hypothetical protein